LSRESKILWQSSYVQTKVGRNLATFDADSWSSRGLVNDSERTSEGFFDKSSGKPFPSTDLQKDDLDFYYL
jgi:hypothetical protein